MNDPINKNTTSQNFVVGTFELASKMEDNVEKYVKGTNDNEKHLEEMWKTSNKKKQDLQLILANNYKIMAYVSTACMVTSLACTITGAAASQKGNELLGNLLNSIGSNGTNFGSQIATNLSTQSNQITSSAIEERTLAAQKYWEGNRANNNTRKEELKGLENKVNEALGNALDKTSSAYSVTRG